MKTEYIDAVNSDEMNEIQSQIGSMKDIDGEGDDGLRIDLEMRDS